MRFLFCLFAACLIAFHSLPASAAISIIEQGKSSFSIVIPAQAPASLKAAANELQQSVKLATGADLPLRADDAAGSTPFISLGATKQAQAAGVLQRKIAEEGFSILTRDGNIYIWGPDTADGETTQNGGTSNGTANGIYTFLEDYLDVRWLMPGNSGAMCRAAIRWRCQRLTAPKRRGS